jgi:hypothetical protein
MNKSKPASGSQRLVSEIQLARLRLAKAESGLDSARQQARLAKRRRKEAKQAARHARKQVKEAKAELRNAKQVLLAAEEKLVLARKRAALSRRQAKAPQVAKATIAASKRRKKAAPPRRSRLAMSAVTPAPAGVEKRPPNPGPVELAFPTQQPVVPGAEVPVTFAPGVETLLITTASSPETPARVPETEIRSKN